MNDAKRSALVTGGSRGIGAATALALAGDGWDVAVNYRENAEAAKTIVDKIHALGGNAIAVQADVTKIEEIESMLDTVVEQQGPVLALVNNAGITADGLSIQLKDEDWSRVIETDLTAAFRLTRRVLPGMLKQRFGRIVNVASVVGIRANPGQSNYSAAKAGLIGFSRTVAVEVARKGITVNSVVPGLIATELTGDVSETLAAQIPARRVGRPEDVAAAIQFLISDSAQYITGTELVVDGGFSA